MDQHLKCEGRLPTPAQRQRAKKEAALERQHARREGRSPVYRGNIFESQQTTLQVAGRGGSMMVSGQPKSELERIEARLRSIDRLDRRKAAKIQKLMEQRMALRD